MTLLENLTYVSSEEPLYRNYTGPHIYGNTIIRQRFNYDQRKQETNNSVKILPYERDRV
jgi:hypothetical protein